MAVAAYETNIECFTLYAGFTNFSPGLDRVNQEFGRFIEDYAIQRQRAEQLLRKAENSAVFNGRRLGTNWNCLYLELLKAYISFKTGWNETTVFTSITRLVQAAHYVLGRYCSANVRNLLQKALRHFEENTDNTTIIMLARALVRNHEELYKQFPPVLIRPAAT
jgi:hypothetical protein